MYKNMIEQVSFGIIPKRVFKNGHTSAHITLVSFYANRKRKAMPNQKKKGQDLTPVL
jgi:hypothetical protein